MPSGTRFLVGFLAGVVGLVASLGTLFIGLDQADRLKAPAFANRLSFDEKMRLLRHEPVADIEILLVGSSTTLHGVDGNVLREELRLEGGVANFGVQDLRINQVRFLADQFLASYPKVAQVVMVSTFRDFSDCQNNDARFFNPDHVRKYLSRSLPELFYQFKYLDLEGVVKRAASIQYLRQTRADLEAVSFDRYGSLLLNVPRERVSQRLWGGDRINLDPACYASLHALAVSLGARDLAFIYVIAPMRPGYLAGRDPDGALLAEHRQRLQQQLGGTGTLVVDAHAALAMPDAAFFDAYHLKRDEALALTRYIAAQMVILSAGPRQDAPTGRATGVTQAAG